MKKKEDLNRLKVVLAEKKCTNKWLAGKLNRDQAQSPNGAQIQHNIHWRR